MVISATRNIELNIGGKFLFTCVLISKEADIAAMNSHRTCPSSFTRLLWVDRQRYRIKDEKPKRS